MIERIVIAVLVVIVVGVAAIFVSAIFKRKIKAKKADKPKVEKNEPSQEKPAEQKAEPEQFKITKKERQSKISRKALKTDSRTVGQPVIEKVYARTPEVAEPSSNIEVNQRLSVESEQFIEKLGSMETNGKLVMSLGDIKREQAEAKAKAEQTEVAEDDGEWSKGQGLKKDLWSSMDARDLNIKPLVSDDFYGHFTGDYSGIKIGGAASNLNNKDAKTDTNKAEEQPIIPPTPVPGGWKDAKSSFDLPGMDDIMARNPFGSGPFGNPFGRPIVPGSQQKTKTFDLAKAVEAEAILNRKGKSLKKTNQDKK